MNILRTSNGSGHTSAPLNSFTLARTRLYKDEKTTFLSFNKNDASAVNLFLEKFKEEQSSIKENLVFLEAKGNIRKFWKIANQQIEILSKKGKFIVHSHQPRSGFIVALAARLKNKSIPIVYTIHNHFNNYSLKYKIALFFNFLLSNKITFVSKDSFDSFKFYRYFFKKKCVVIQNGVDVERIEKITCANDDKNLEKTNKIKLITTGRLTKQKNQKFLLEVLEGFGKDWLLDLYGSGELEDEIKEFIKKHNIGNKVQLKGTVPRDEILKAYHNADIYISAANWEGLPIAVMEAMTAGIPCIISDIPSHIELGRNLPGISYVNFDKNDWHSALNYWFTLNEEERQSLGKKNREIIYQEHTMQIMQKKYRALYESLI